MLGDDGLEHLGEGLGVEHVLAAHQFVVVVREHRVAFVELLNLTKALSTELGADNVLVNAVCPGWVDTGLWRRNAAGLAAELGAGSEDEARRLAARKNALGRFGRPEELAAAIAFLCSERASYITGVSLSVDGGRLKSLF